MLSPAAPASTPSATPTYLWIVGGLSLVWNAFGAFDYLMTQLQAEFYMSAFTDEQLAYFYGFPAWATAAWATAVWSSVAGSLALLLRRRWAVPAFGLAIVGMLVSSFYTLGLTEGVKVMGGAGQLAFTVVIWLVAVGLFVYARRQATAGVLH